MPTAFTPELLQLIVSNDQQRPLLFANARIITTDPLVGDLQHGDLLLGGSRIVGIGPGLLTAADDDAALVIDCEGLVIVPAIIDTAALAGLRTHRSATAGALAPGNPATFAVLAADPREPVVDILSPLTASTSPAEVVVVDGVVVQWAGRPTTTPTAQQASTADGNQAPNSHLGTWIDENDFVHQHLTSDGRYDETRGGREHAFQGAFWIDGDRIDYLDDLGFWAFGEFIDGTLEHAGYTFHRA